MHSMHFSLRPPINLYQEDFNFRRDYMRPALMAAGGNGPPPDIFGRLNISLPSASIIGDFQNLAHNILLLPKNPPPLPVCSPSEYSQQPLSNLLSLPIELIEKIFTYLPCMDVQLLSSDCDMCVTNFKYLAVQIYALALSCKTFCALTHLQRTSILVRGRTSFSIAPMYAPVDEERNFKLRFKNENSAFIFKNQSLKITPLLKSGILTVPSFTFDKINWLPEETNSFSAKCMTHLIDWRNDAANLNGNKIAYITKVAAVELALPVVAIAAAAEATACKISCWAAEVFRPITTIPLEWCQRNKIIEREQSSITTLFRAIPALHQNIFKANLLVHSESQYHKPAAINLLTDKTALLA